MVLAISASTASANTVINITTPFAVSVFIPCANQGNGELVDFTGSLHQTLSITVNGNNVNIHEASNPQGAKGVGEITGDVWQANGVTFQDLNASVSGFPFEATFVNNIRLINGKEGSVLTHQNIHVTVNANGTATVFQDNSSFICK
jgi:hypothetical protein